MQSLHPYIPTDRLHALARGRSLPERASGAALFADIAGFTPLTEALVRALGAQRGAEELPIQLNRIYDALIAEVDRYQGSVIGFSGDAITCWFDDASFELAGLDAQPAEATRWGLGRLRLLKKFAFSAAGGHGGGRQRPKRKRFWRVCDPPNLPPSGRPRAAALGAAARAAACALAIQQAMRQFASIAIPGAGSVTLAIKVAVAAGPVRRLLVGDPSIQLIDALAGATLDRLAAGEHLASQGDVLLDQAAAAALGEQLSVAEWRTDAASGDRFALVRELAAQPPAAPWPALDPAALSHAQLRPWLLRPVYERLSSGLGEFLTELRPAAALFMRFGGIDYDHDEQAQPKLDAFIRWVQRILEQYGGAILQLTIGDKGCYLYSAFGAPQAHEDDSTRAVAAALALRAPELPSIEGVQIGVSQGRMRTGAYGGVTRRTYGALGDEVNLAARLMQHAPAGQALVSLSAQRLTGDAFGWQNLPPLRVKGKAEPVTVFQPAGARERRSIRLHEPRYGLPMVGRRDELAQIGRAIDRVQRGYGQIVGVTAEAGMGKSRLLAEAIRLAGQRRLQAYGGECQAYGTNSSYLVWQNIWRGLFELDPAWSAEQQAQALAQQLGAINPALLPRLPLLGAVLGLGLPDNELTQSLDAKLRKSSLEALLADCLHAIARRSPLLLVLEDCHWLDPLSHDLLEVLGRAIVHMPVLLLIAYRPPQVQRMLAPRVAQLAHFSELQLATLPDAEIEQLVSSKLAQLYGETTDAPAELVRPISQRAQGNPFYIEELLNYLHDRGVDPQQPGAIEQLALPDSLHGLILSRIDQLSENQQILLKVASVIGRLFRAAMLWGVYNQFGDQERVRTDLDVLSSLELTPLDTPDPELAYLFKHILTQEVAYTTLPFATRGLLHGQIGQYIERSYADAIEQYTDLLAYHYDNSDNLAKRREYLLKAGAQAQADYSNLAAQSYYERLLPLLAEHERGEQLLRLGQVLEVIGQWPEADARYREALALAEQLAERPAQAQAQALIGELLRKQGQYSQALSWLEQAHAGYLALADRAGTAQALHFLGSLDIQQGSYDQAIEHYAASLAIRRELADQPMIASLLSNMSIVAFHQGDEPGAWALCRESLAIRRAAGNRLWIANSLGNLGMLALEAERYDEAQASMEEALALERNVGDRAAIAISLNNLGNVARAQADYERAHALYGESLTLNQGLGDGWALAYLLEDLGCLAALQDAPERALQLAGAAAGLRDSIGAPLSPPEQAGLDRKLARARASRGPAAEHDWEAGRALTLEQAIELALGSAA